MTYGPIAGVPNGARFRTRRALYDRRAHHDIRQIICGGTDGTDARSGVSWG